MEKISDFIENGSISKEGIQKIEQLIEENKQLKKSFIYYYYYYKYNGKKYKKIPIFYNEKNLTQASSFLKSEINRLLDLIEYHNNLKNEHFMESSKFDRLMKKLDVLIKKSNPFIHDYSVIFISEYYKSIIWILFPRLFIRNLRKEIKKLYNDFKTE
jgi:hypothetical protein